MIDILISVENIYVQCRQNLKEMLDTIMRCNMLNLKAHVTGCRLDL